MHLLATAAQPSAPGAWAYLVVFLAAAAGYMGIPVIGTAVIGAAAILASQGELCVAFRQRQLGFFALADIDCHVDDTDNAAVPIAQGLRIGNDGNA